MAALLEFQKAAIDDFKELSAQDRCDVLHVINALMAIAGSPTVQQMEQQFGTLPDDLKTIAEDIYGAALLQGSIDFLQESKP